MLRTIRSSDNLEQQPAKRHCANFGLQTPPESPDEDTFAIDASQTARVPTSAQRAPETASVLTPPATRSVSPSSASLAYQGYLELRSAISDGDNGRFTALLAHHVQSVGCSDPLYGKTLLHVAVDANELTMMQSLLDAGAPKDARDKRYKRTPLHQAMHLESEEAVALLLSAGVNVNMLDIQGYSPLQSAVADDKPEIARMLRAAGARASQDTRFINPRRMRTDGRPFYERVVSADTLEARMAATSIDDDGDTQMGGY